LPHRALSGEMRRNGGQQGKWTRGAVAPTTRAVVAPLRADGAHVISDRFRLRGDSELAIATATK
jgi:hypothetical protein